MMDPQTGVFREIAEAELQAALDDGQIVGRLDAIEQASRRIQLGEAELERRKARRKQQKASRKLNR